MATPIENQTSVILGRISNSQNRPLPQLLVQAYDRDMRSEELLGEALTDRQGNYEIRWDSSQPDSRGKRTADIVLKVLTPELKTQLYASDMNSIRFNAGAREEINVTLRTAVPQERVEFEFILSEVLALAGDVAVSDLQENDQHQDISFLAKEAEIPAAKIEHLVVAHRLQNESKIPAEFFYALLRENTLLKSDWANSIQVRLSIGLGTDIVPLLLDASLITPDVLQRDVALAVEELIVSTKLLRAVGGYIEQLLVYKPKAQAYYQNEHQQKVLELFSRFVEQDKVGELVRLFKDNRDDVNGFFTQINSAEFFQADGLASSAKAGIILGRLLGFETSLISTVMTNQNIAREQDVRRLATLTAADWKVTLSDVNNQLSRTATPIDASLLDFHAEMLVNKLTAEYPTVAFAGNLSRDAQPVLRHQKELVAFLEQQPDFDLQHTLIDQFFSTNKLATPDNTGLQDELKTVQRLGKLQETLDYAKTQGLLQQKIHSAHSIVAAGESRFVNDIAPNAGIGATEARQMFKRAQRTQTAAMLIFGELQDSMRNLDLPALQANTAPTVAARVLNPVNGETPDFKSLFKLTDSCACEHCRSVYSPAAYMVEVLQFLENRKVIDSTLVVPNPNHEPKAIEALLLRRPDLGDVDLSCENANTPMPYIDLVCEVLEAEIAPDPGIPYIGRLSTLAPNFLIGKVEPLLATALKDLGVTNEAMIYGTEQAGGPVAPYYLRDKKAVCKIVQNAPGNYTVFKLRQTLASAEELAAAPAYVNESAYTLLKAPTLKYAFELPFDLDHAEAKAYFERFGVARADVMQAFQVIDPPNDAAIAAERLGLTDAERILVTTPAPTLTGQQDIWNAPAQWDSPAISGSVVDYMQRLDHFLDKTGLTYQQTEWLLTLQFIDPTKNLFIFHHDLKSCDTAKKEIKNLDVAALDRIHRFLRLHRKTGWAFELLDDLIKQSQLGNGVLDNNCLIHAAHLLQLADETGLKIRELLGFYGALAHEVLSEHAPVPLYQSVFLNKAKNGFEDDRLQVKQVLEVTNGTLLLKLQDVKTSLAVCLQTSEQDLNKLLVLPPNDKLVFDNLSYLFAASRLIRKLKLKVDDFIALLDLTGINIHDSPAATLDFVQAAKAARALPLKPFDVRFMLWHDPVLSEREMKLEKIDGILGKLQTDYKQAYLTAHTGFKPLVGCDLELLQVASNTGRNLVAVGLQGSNLHLRMFDYSGAIIFDKTEPNLDVNRPDLTPVILQLKASLNTFLGGTSLTDPQIKKCIELARLIAGFILLAEDQKEVLVQQLPKLPGIGEEDVAKLVGLVEGNFNFNWIDGNGVQVVNTTAVTAATYLHFKLDVSLGNATVNAIATLALALETALGTLPTLTSNYEAAQTATQNAQAAVDAAQQVVDATPSPAASAALATAQQQLTLVQAAEAAAFQALQTVEYKRNDLVEAFLASIATYQYQLAKHTILEQSIASNFKTDLGLTKIVLQYAKLKVVNPNTSGTDLLSDLLLSELPDPINPDSQKQALKLLHKMLPLMVGFKLDNTAIAWHFQHNVDLNWFIWDEIPYESGSVQVSYDRYRNFAEMMSLAKRLPSVPNPVDAQNPITFYSLLDILRITSSVPRIDFLEAFSVLTGYEFEMVEWVDNYQSLLWNGQQWDTSLYFNADFWKKIETSLEMLRLLNINVNISNFIEPIATLIAPVLTPTAVEILRANLKSRYDEDTWLETLKEIMDVLRPQKRDALVAYLLATNPSMKNANDLYDFFLIDTQMEACMPSSRIVIVHNILQLFVQRCLMGLEPQALANVEDDVGWEQWQWMKNYRVWEANRKVFLYPENWIEPSLRDDKSFLFKELENELQQNELTNDTAEQAIIKYMQKLDDISFLEVMATWYQSNIKTMHVFARTKGGDPAIYYYRRFVAESFWTNWEKVELDITGDHLLAFMHNHRLMLAWPVFSEVPAPEQKSKIPDATPGTEVTNEKPKRQLKIQLAVSEFTNNAWQPKKISKDGLLTPPNFTNNEYELKRDRYNLIYFEATKQVWFFTTNTAFYLNSGYQSEAHTISGVFNLLGCKGYPELTLQPVKWPGCWPDFLPDFKKTLLASQRYNENNEIAIQEKGENLTIPDDLSVRNGVVPFNFLKLLQSTPGFFHISYPHQFTSIDFVSFLFQFLFGYQWNREFHEKCLKIPLGTMLPYFMEDSEHNYVIIPRFYGRVERKGQKEPVILDETASEVMQLIERVFAFYNRFIFKYGGNWDTFFTLSATENEKERKEHSADITEYYAIAAILGEFRQLRYKEQFKNFYHPLICPLRKTLYEGGVPALMKREVQLQQTPFNFQTHYQPTANVLPPYPIENVDFSTDGSYSSYNWELFFHIPFLIATRLTQNQRFEEAMRWFHYIFNPTGALPGAAPQKYWVTKPFYEFQDYTGQRINDLFSPSNPALADLEFAIDQWRKHPFQPFVVARFRQVAFQKAVLIKYVDNLIQWGDYLFRQDTMESVVQATQLYILADKLLGQKPRTIPPVIKPPYESYNQVKAKLDDFGNAAIQLENLIPDLTALPESGAELPNNPSSLPQLYFCIPQNDKMLEYWDRVADRLFKIRHCQDINGVERNLALFAPPIDPGMLVRAAASGLSISDVLSGLNAPLPYYRFNVLAQKASELANEVRSLGSSLLQALEKKDAEAMALLRSELELNVLNAVRDMKKLQINEANEQIEVLKRTKKVTEERQKYYAGIEKISSKEQLNLDKLSKAQEYQNSSQIVRTIAGALSLIPEFHIGAEGFGGSPSVVMQLGGSALSKATSIGADILNILGSVASYEASRAATLGGYDRRFEDWQLQERTASLELKSIDKQIVAAEIRKAIAETDLRNHDLQIDNAKKTDEFMRAKFTNKELYDWMIGQISAVYFSAYQLSHDFAKKAERCYRFELGNDDAFIGFGYWDSLKKGLESANRLIHDIKRMETSYLDKNKREYELTKHVSLAMLDPLALIRLRQTGVCDFEIPEVLYDMDHPSHYFQRLRNVSVSIPCIAGPYTSISAKLSLIKNRYRKNLNPDNAAGTGYPEDLGNDERFQYNIGAIQSIATSSGQNDSGVFELNFKDERYLPFEGTGAISSWRLELPEQVRQFDYNTIADVILHVKYTAREGGSGLKKLANDSLVEQLGLIKQQLKNEDGLHIALNLKHDFPNEWHLLKNTGTANLTIDKSRLPYMAQALDAAIGGVIFIVKDRTNPPNFVVNVGGTNMSLARKDEWKLCQGNINGISLETPFSISVTPQPSLDNLEELIMVVEL